MALKVELSRLYIHPAHRFNRPPDTGFTDSLPICGCTHRPARQFIVGGGGGYLANGEVGFPAHAVSLNETAGLFTRRFMLYSFRSPLVRYPL